MTEPVPRKNCPTCGAIACFDAVCDPEAVARADAFVALAPVGMADVEKFTQGPERDAVDEAQARWGQAQLAWVGAGKPESGPECTEMVSAYQAVEATLDALHLAAFGVPFPRQGRAA